MTWRYKSVRMRKTLLHKYGKPNPRSTSNGWGSDLVQASRTNGSARSSASSMHVSLPRTGCRPFMSPDTAAATCPYHDEAFHGDGADKDSSSWAASVNVPFS